MPQSHFITAQRLARSLINLDRSTSVDLRFYHYMIPVLQQCIRQGHKKVTTHYIENGQSNNFYRSVLANGPRMVPMNQFGAIDQFGN